jgi:hypothetical protein
MSEPTTTAAIPKPEDKPTEVTSAVEPSPETKVETPAPVPDAPKEDVKADEPATTEVRSTLPILTVSRHSRVIFSFRLLRSLVTPLSLRPLKPLLLPNPVRRRPKRISLPRQPLRKRTGLRAHLSSPNFWEGSSLRPRRR